METNEPDNTPGGELSDYERGRRDGIQSALKDARYHITGHLATAEKWRYDRVVRDFGILLGEIDESVLETWDGADYLRNRQIEPEHLKVGDTYTSYDPESNQFISEIRLFDGEFSEEEKKNPHAEYFLQWNVNSIHSEAHLRTLLSKIQSTNKDTNKEKSSTEGENNGNTG